MSVHTHSACGLPVQVCRGPDGNIRDLRILLRHIHVWDGVEQLEEPTHDFILQ